MFGKKIITFDIGGTKILKSVVAFRNRGYEFLDLVEEKNPRNEKRIKEILLSYCLESQKIFKTKKVSFSSAGIVDSEKKIISPAKWYGANKFDFSFLEIKNFSIKVENDGRCFALGEYHFGKASGRENILALALGTGIGGGYILNGQNLRGEHSSALEVSHMSIFINNKWKRWWEFSSGGGIQKNYFLVTKKRESCQSIFKLASNNERNAKEVVDRAAEMLGMGIANLCCIIDPEMFVIGGSLSKQKDFVKKGIQIAQKNVFNKKANYKFAISALGNKANLLGAASLFL